MTQLPGSVKNLKTELKLHFVKGRFGLRKEDLVYEKKVLSQKGRFCLKKEGFIFVYSFAPLAYICYEMNKLRFFFFFFFFVYERKNFVY